MDEPRWSALFVLTFLAGLALAGWPQWSGADASLRVGGGLAIDWLFALALATAWHCHTRSMWVAMAWCGLMYDLFLGGRIGANVLLFMAAGMVLDSWRRDGVRLSRWGMRWWAGFALALGVAWLRPSLQAPSFWVAYAPGELRSATWAALGTAAVVPLLEATMEAGGLRTWRRAEPLR